jgi:exonuclease III
MPYTYKRATININGIASQAPLKMLEDYLRQQNIDIVLLQGVTYTKITSFRRYNAYVNVGAENRCTAILAKEGLPLTNTTRLPSGRGIAVSFEGIKLIYIYAPPGAEKRRERERLSITQKCPSSYRPHMRRYSLPGILNVFSPMRTARERETTVKC